MPLVDLAGPFNAAAHAGGAVIYTHDEHWTPAGHALAAEVLLASPLFVGPAH